MLTAEIKVNGCLIGHLKLVNKMYLGDEGGHYYEGEYQRSGDKKVQQISLIHKREDGAEKNRCHSSV